MEADRFLKYSEVRELNGGLCRTTWWRMIKRGDAPPAVQVSSNRVAWSLQQIRDWQDSAKARAA